MLKPCKLLFSGDNIGIFGGRRMSSCVEDDAGLNQKVRSTFWFNLLDGYSELY